VVVALVEDCGVEGVAAGLYPDPRQYAFASARLQGQAVDERLGDGLKRERPVVVPGYKTSPFVVARQMENRFCSSSRISGLW
jgi:hypothetical protein